MGDGVPVGALRTLETWFRTTTTNSLIIADSERVGLGVGAANQLAVFSLLAGQMIPIQLETTVVDGQWHLAQLVVNPADQSATVYLDGTAAWSGSLTVPPVQPGVPPAVALFAGDYDETAVYPSALSAASVAARWAAGAPGPIDATECLTRGSDRYGDAVAADQPVRWYRLNERTTDRTERIGADAAAADGCQNLLLGSGAQTAAGALDHLGDTALTQNGDAIGVADSSGLPAGASDRTLEAWLRPNALGHYGLAPEQWIVRYGNDFGLAAEPAAGPRLRFRWGPGGDQYTDIDVSPADPALGPRVQWDHVVASVHSGTATVYVNGRLVWTAPVTVATELAAGDLYLGSASSGSGERSGISVDELAVYPTALTPERIKAHWVRGASKEPIQCPPVPTNGLVQIVLEDQPSALYRLDELAHNPESRLAVDVIRCAHGSYGEPSERSTVESVAGARAGDTNTAAARALDVVNSEQDQPLLLVPLDSLPVGNEARTVAFWGRVPQGAHALAVAYGDIFPIAFGADGSPLPGVGPPNLTLADPQQWHHFAITSDGELGRLYIDGLPVLDGPWDGSATGAQSFITVASGAVDELVVYDRVLSLERIAAHAATRDLRDTQTTLVAPTGAWSSTEPTEFEVEVDSTDPSPPGGQVQLYDDGTPIGAPTSLSSAGTATVDVQLTGGTHRISARYLGDSQYVASRSDTVERDVVGSDQVELNLILSDEVIEYGDSETATIQLSSPTPAVGPVHLLADGTTIATIDTTNLPSTITLPHLHPGTRELSARYDGSAQHQPAVSTTRELRVKKATPTVVSLLNQTAAVNQQQFVAGVQRPAGGVNPTGTIELWVDGQLLRTQSLWAMGMFGNTSFGMFTDVAPPAVGTHQVRIVYRGDTRYERSEWSGPYQVLAGAIQVELVSSDTDAYPGDPITFTATVTANGQPVSEGLVRFFDNGGTAHTTEVNTSGTATWTVTNLVRGHHDIRAEFAGISSPSVSQTVRRAVHIGVDNGSVDHDGLVTGTISARETPSDEVPQGWVVLSVENGPQIGAIEIDPDGTFTMEVSYETPLGRHPIVAYYYPYVHELFPPFDHTAQHDLELTVLPSADTTGTVTVTAPANSTEGDTVEVTAAVALDGGQVAGGDVELLLDGETFAVETLEDQTATFTLSHLDVGPHTLVARYAHLESDQVDHLVRPLFEYPIETDIVLDDDTVEWGQPIRGRVTTGVDAPDDLHGDVALADASHNLIGVAGVSADGTFTVLPYSSLTSGAQSLTAVFDPLDPNVFQTAIVQDLQLDVTTAPSRIEFTPQRWAATVDDGLVALARVGTDADHPALVTGNVSLYLDGATDPFWTAPIVEFEPPLEPGSIYVPLAELPGGPHTIRAVYHGRDGVEPTEATTVATFRHATVTQVSIDPSSVQLTGTAATIHANVDTLHNGPTATGSVQFAIDGQPVGVVPLTDGHAALTVDPASTISPNPSVIPGSYTVTAEYLPTNGSRFIASTAPSVPWVTLAQPATPVLTVTPDSPTMWTDSSAGITVTADRPWLSGTLEVIVDGQAVGSVSMTNGYATWSTDQLALGDHTISVSYAGSNVATPATSNVATLRIRYRPIVNLTIEPDATTAAGESATYQVEVTAADPTAPQPTGAVNLSVSGTAVGAIQLDSLGRGSITVDGPDWFINGSPNPVMRPGQHAVVAAFQPAEPAVYGPASRFGEHTVTGTITPSIEIAPTGPQLVGEPVTLTAQVTPPWATGNATVLVDGEPAADVTFAQGFATWTLADLPLGQHTVVVDYHGSSTTEPVTSEPVELAIVEPVEVTLALAATSAVFGQPLDATLSVTPTTASPCGPPTGTVWLEGTGPSGPTTSEPVTLAAGPAVIGLSAGQPFEYSYTAHYSGDDCYPRAQSGPAQLTVDKASTNSSISFSASPADSADETTATIAVATQSPGTGQPTGSVELRIDNDPPVTLDLAGGATTFDLPPLEPGPHLIRVDYTGSTTHEPSQSTASHLILPRTQTTLSTNPPAAGPVGGAITLSAQVTSIDPGPQAAGAVAFYVNDQYLTSAAVTGGTAATTFVPATTGTYAFEARFTSSTHSRSTNTTSYTAHRATTQPAITLSHGLLGLSSNEVPRLEELTIGIGVTGVAALAAPTGTASIAIDGDPVEELDLDAATAELTIDNLTAGVHEVVVTYSGDDLYEPSTATSTVTVLPARTSSSLQVSADPIDPDQPTQLTATVTRLRGGPVTAGSVVFTGGGLDVEAPLNSDGVAAITANFGPGDHTLQARFVGSADDAEALSTPATIRVRYPAAVAVSAVASQQPADGPFWWGSQVSVTATVTGVDGQPGSGTVTLTQNGGPPSSPIAAVNGLATTTITADQLGPLVLAVDYSGSMRHSTATADLSVDVVPSPTTAQLAVSANVVAANQPLELTAQVTQTSTGAPVAEGDVEFWDLSGGERVLIGTAVISGPAHQRRARLTTSELAAGSHDIVARYVGDQHRAASPDSAATQVTVRRLVDLTLTDPPTESVYGSAPTLSVTVADAAGGAIPVGGQLILWNSTQQLAAVDITGTSVVQVPVPVLSVGNHQLRVSYSGDPVHDTATTSPLNHTVTRAAPQVSVSSPTATPVAGQPVQLRGVVARPAGSAGAAPAGTVTFRDGANIIGTASMSNAGSGTAIAVMTTSSLGGGSRQITATYGGDARYQPGLGTVTVDVARRTTTTTITASTAVSNPGDDVELTSTVTTTAGSTVAVGAGSVSFYDGDQLLGTANLTSAGVAQLTTALPPGARTLRAQYDGTNDFATSSSANLAHLVASPVNITLQASPTITYGTATVVSVDIDSANPVAPSGTVRLRRAGSSAPLGSPVTLLAGAAQLPAGVLGAGRHTLVVDYLGDVNHAPGMSDTIDVVVEPLAMPVNLFVQPATVEYSTQTVLTARVDPANGVVPTGIVSFYNGDDPIGMAALTPSGLATMRTRSLTVGTHSITARFGGIGNTAPSRSTSIQVTVMTAPPVFTIEAPQRLRADGTASIAVTVTAPGGAPAAGQVEFWSIDGEQQLIAERPLDANGVARLECRAVDADPGPQCGPLAPGVHAFKVTRGSPDTLVGGGESAPFTIAVEAARNVTLTANPPAVAWAGSKASIDVEVEGDPDESPTGEVQLIDVDTNQAIGTAQLEPKGDGLSTAAVSTGAVPADTEALNLLVSYPGDDLHRPTNSNALAIPVKVRHQLRMTTPARTTPAGGTSDPITIEVVNGAGDPVAAPAGGTTLGLSSTSNGAYFIAGADDDADQITIPAGATSATFALRNNAAGNHLMLITAPEIGITSAQQFAFNVTRGSPAQLEIVPDQRRAPVGTAAAAFRVYGADQFGNDLGNLTAQISLTSPGATCAAGTCTPTQPGQHQITATLGELTDTATLTANSDPVVDITDVTTDPDDDRRLTFSIDAQDPDGDNLTYVIYWGDGSAPTEPAPVPTSGLDVTHDYGEQAAIMVIKVNDANGYPVWATHRVEAVDVDSLRANPGDDQQGLVGEPLHFDATNSTPRTAHLDYLWDFGDGTESAAARPTHTYSQAGQYTVTLRVRRGLDTSVAATSTVTVGAADGSGVFANVVTAGGAPLSAASVVVQSADGASHKGVERTGQPGRYLIPGVPAGQHTLFAYRNGYQPTTVTFTATGGTDVVPVTLTPGAPVVTELTTRRISAAEAADLGVDFGAGGNTNIVEFHLELLDGRRLTVLKDRTGGGCIATTDDKLFRSRNTPNPNHAIHDDCELGAFSGGTGMQGIQLSGNTVTILNKTRASWSKEVFDVSLTVVNIGPTGFTLETGVADLTIPPGLSLAETFTGAQTPQLGVEPIASGQAATVRWQLRGDTEGFYDLTATYRSILAPVGDPVVVTAVTDVASRIRVWGASAIQANVDADVDVVAAQPHRQQLTVTNVADVPAYNLAAGLTASRDGARVSVLAQPRQQGTVRVGALAAGSSLTAPESRLLYPESGRLPEELRVDINGGELAVHVHRRGNPATMPAPTLTASASGLAEDGAVLSWEPVPGATGYAVFSTDSYVRAFPYQPVATTDADTTEVALPATADGYGKLAVSAIVQRDGALTYEMAHPLLDTQGVLSPGPDPHGVRDFDPCTGYGLDPTTAYPGNFVFPATDLSVAGLGPELALRRTYNSTAERTFDDVTAYFGIGQPWALNFALHGVMDDAGHFALVLGDGRCINAVPDPQNPGVYEIESPGERWTALWTSTGDELGGYTDLTNHTTQTRYRLDGRGRLVWIEDQAGRRQSVTWSGPDPRFPEWIDRLPVAITDEASGRSIEFEWNDRADLVSATTDPVTSGSQTASLQWRYYYDNQRNLTAACDPNNNASPADGGTCTTYGYTDGKLTRITDPEGHGTQIGYDDRGRKERVTDATGATVSFAYSTPAGRPAHTLITTTDPRGNVTTAEYDANYRLVAATGPDGEAIADYDPNGYLTSLTVPGQSVTLTPNNNGVPTEITSSRTGTTRYAVTSQNEITGIAGPVDNDLGQAHLRTTITYNEQRQPLSQTTPSPRPGVVGSTTTWTYSAANGTTPAEGGGFVPPGLVLTESRPVPVGVIGTNTTSYAYDRHGNLVRTTSPTGVVTTSSFDELGRLVQVAVAPPDAAPSTTSYRYDWRGNPIEVVGTATTNSITDVTHQLVTTNEYDQTGRLTQVEVDDVTGDSPTRLTTFDYDEVGREISRSVRIDEERTATTRREYDSAGNLTRIIDAEGRATRRVYDDANREIEVWLERYVDPNLGGMPRDIRLTKRVYEVGTGRVFLEIDAVGRSTRYRYDTAGRLEKTWITGVRLANGTTGNYVTSEVLSFDAAGRPLVERSANGTLTVEYRYDRLGRVIEQATDPDGVNRVRSYEYDVAGNLTVDRLAGYQLQYGATGTGTATVLGGEETRFVFDAAGRRTQRIVENGSIDLVTAYGRDALGRITAVTDPNGNTTNRSYDPLGRLTAVTEPLVPVNGDATVMQRPTTTYGYDAYGNRTHTKDAEQHVTTTSYNTIGWRTAATLPTYVRPVDGDTITATTTWAHDLTGAVIETTTPGGAVTRTIRDTAGRAVRSERPGPTVNQTAVTSTRYDDVGRAIQTIGASGLRTTMGYDKLDRLTSRTEYVAATAVTEPVVATTSLAYDDGSNVVQTNHPTSGTSTATYNAVGEMLTSISAHQFAQPNPQPVTYHYDVVGRPTATIDELGRVTATTYDPAGRTTSTRVLDRTTGTWAATTSTYDANGNLVAQSDPLGTRDGYATTFAYDAGNRLASVTQPVDAAASITTTYGYDLTGNQTSVTDGRQHTTTSTYNPWGRLESVTEPATALIGGGTSPTTDRTYTTSYDADGRTAALQVPGGISITSSYDLAGNLIEQTGTSPDTEAAPNAARSWTYDLAGRMTAASRPGGSTSFAYDQRGLMVASDDGDTNATYRYDAGGQMTSRVDGRGTASFSYGPGGVLTAETDPVSGRGITHRYDAAAQLVETIADTPGYASTADGGTGDRQRSEYLYDDAGRLTTTAVSGGNGDLRYREGITYDLNGRIVERDVIGQAATRIESYTYDRAGRLTRTDTASDPDATPVAVAYTWDAAGNRTSAGGESFSYDERNRLIESTAPYGNSTIEAAFTWSPRGTRDSAVFTEISPDGEPLGSRDQTWTHDAVNQRVAATDTVWGDSRFEWDALGRITRAGPTGGEVDFDYEQDGNDPVELADVARGTRPDGSTVSTTDWGISTVNTHGEIVAGTTDGGATTTWAFDAFGVPAAGSFYSPYGYQGDPTEPASGHVWMGARFYDPATATFTTRDTWAGLADQPVTLNRYSYANNDPINNWDPTGHFAVVTDITDRQRMNWWLFGPAESGALLMYDLIGVSGMKSILGISAGMAATASASSRAVAESPAIGARTAGAGSAVATAVVGTGTTVLALAAVGLLALRMTIVIQDGVDRGIDLIGGDPEGNSSLTKGQCAEFLASGGVGLLAEECLRLWPELARYLPAPIDTLGGSNGGGSDNDLDLGNGDCDAANASLGDLPVHPNQGKFWVRAGELVSNRFPSHPINPGQMSGGEEVGHGGVQNLSNEELVRPGGPAGNDPISGYRDWAPGDDWHCPGSEVHITGGHHRTAEIAERVADGRLQPDTLIEFVRTR